MSGVNVRLPAMLSQVVGGERVYAVEGASLKEALDDLVRRRPGLAVHLFDDAGALRRHIRCFCNGSVLRGDEGLAQPLRAGDTVTLLNSVSGG
jgi:molybdopterin converting factor small subunit